MGLNGSGFNATRLFMKHLRYIRRDYVKNKQNCFEANTVGLSVKDRPICYP